MTENVHESPGKTQVGSLFITSMLKRLFISFGREGFFRNVEQRHKKSKHDPMEISMLNPRQLLPTLLQPTSFPSLKESVQLESCFYVESATKDDADSVRRITLQRESLG
jgi:hypothetical protein